MYQLHVVFNNPLHSDYLICDSIICQHYDLIIIVSRKDLHATVNCTGDIRFEMASILYNIGALHTLLGASEPRNTAESLKAACSHFQKAAWCFQCVKDEYPQPSGVDVGPEMMKLYQEICLAQGQECILDKSIQDTKKPSVVGKLKTL